MDQAPSLVMESTRRISRKSIHTFLKYFGYLSTTPALLLLPFSAEALLTASSSSSLHAFNSLSHAMFVCPLSLLFALSTFLMAKASIIQALKNPHKPSLIFRPHLSSNLVLVTTINMFCFFIFIFALNFLRSSSDLFLILARIVVCAFWANNMLVISNLALVVAAMEDCKWFEAIYKACLLRNGNHSMALLVALPTNLGFAAIVGLFRFRVLQVYHSFGRLSATVALEGVLIAYLYSLLIVLDTIACCLFYKNCYDIENIVQEKPESLEVLP
ncbi:hypothetical protein Ddye_008762 [Dipteronia dyeriana]|uniref:Uncharacterized protein n=1 Tax=Dipteronia dyeriana TaxID=168575 RepID=A0AAD9XA47_9ROSI|nr:hypothetical protein Ddye_008762 [Dipteronia dyeriana]